MSNRVGNLVNMLDGYVGDGGHHLNVNVFDLETLWTRRRILKSIPSSPFVFPVML